MVRRGEMIDNIKASLNSLFLNLANEYWINIILRYSYIIILAVSIVILLVGNKPKQNKRIRVKKNKIKSNQSIYKGKFIDTPIDKMSNALSFTNSFSKEINDLIGVVIVVLYIVLVIVIYRYLGHFAFVWYTKLVNLVTALFLPYAMIHTYISVQINIITNQIPNAFSEILSAYRSDKRIKAAIENATEYMDKNIKREFKRINVYLSSETTFEYGLDYFANRMKNGYITLFCTLIKESRYKSGDITEAIETLAIKTRSKNYMKEKAKRQLVWYRVFLILWLFAIPAVMKFVASASLEAYRFYNTIDGAKLLTMSMLSVVVGYILIMLMEQN